MPLLLMTFALLIVASFATLLWQTRVQYVLSDGSGWNPGYISTATPPPEANAVAMRRRGSWIFMAASVLASLGFAAAWLLGER